MTMIGRYAIIPTHNRHQQVTDLAVVMAGQVDLVIVIDNASTPPLRPEDLTAARDRRPEYPQRPARIWCWRDEEQPPNLSRLWNAGLSCAAYHARNRLSRCEAWNVAILNDDALVPEGWFAPVAAQMREHGAAAAACMPHVQGAIIDTSGRNPRHLVPWAFIMRGELAADADGPLRADERLRWWGSDNLMNVRAQRNGGTLLVHGPLIQNTGANSSTVGPLAEQAGRDRETFREIEGWYAW